MPANVETMAWVGDKTKDLPWHMSPEKLYGYGGEGPMTAAQTIVTAGLDWRVQLLPASVCVQNGNDVRVYQSDEFLHIVRDRDHKILGTCTERYSPIQNSEAFDFLDAVAGHLGQLRYVTAGSIDGGKRVWLLAQLMGSEFDIEPIIGDKSKMYLMLTTGHDGKNSLRCKFTTIRIVCQNTLNLALRTGDEGVNIKHIGDPMKKVQQAQEILGLAMEETSEFRKISTWLADMRVTSTYTNDFLEHMFPTSDKGEKAVTRAKNTSDELIKLASNGKGTHIPGVIGTRWALLNAVTEYNDHERNYRDTKQSGLDTNKFDALFNGGVSEKQKRKALDFLLADAPSDVYANPSRVVESVSA